MPNTIVRVTEIERQSLNPITGEVTIESKIDRKGVSKSSTEYIFMIDKIDNKTLDDPKRQLKTVNDWILLTKLPFYVNKRSGYLSMSKAIRLKLVEELVLPEKTILRSLTHLVKADCLKRVGKGCYLINPLAVYIGGLKDLDQKIAEYEAD